jgi:hypothetical protein
MYIIPKNAHVRNPRTKRIVPSEGMEVSKLDLMWAYRRLAHGDVVEGTPPAASVAPAPEPVKA